VEVTKVSLVISTQATAAEDQVKDTIVMTAYSDGSVFVSRPVETTLPCPMRLKKFPFDTQTCDLTFGSWGSSGEVIDTQARLQGDEPVAFAFSKDYHPNPEFDLVKVRSHSFDSFYA
jgi:hypothetical protein